MATLPIDFNTLNFFSALTNAKLFDDLTSAVSAYNVIDDSRILKEDDIETLIELGQNTPSLTGGSKTGVNVKSLSEDSQTGQVTATDTGTLSLVPAGTFTYALLNAVGVNVTTNDTIKEKISQALTTLYNITICTAEVNSYYIKTVIKDGVTYVKDNVIKKLSDTLYNLGIFSTEASVDTSIGELPVGYKNFTFTSYPPVEVSLLVSALNNALISQKKWFQFVLNEAYHRQYDWTNNNIDVIVNTLINNSNTIHNELMSRCRNAMPNLNGILIYISLPFRDLTTTAAYVTVRYHPVSIADNTLRVKTSRNVIDYFSTGATYEETTVSYENTGGRNSYYAMIPFINGINMGNISYGNQSYTPYVFKNSTKGGEETIVSSLFSSSAPLVDGIDVQIGANIPADNDIDIQVNFPAWYNAGIDIGMYNKEISDIAHGRLIPIDVQAEDTTATTFTKTQAQAQTGTIAQEAENAITVGANELLNSLVNASTGEKVIPTDTVTPNNDNTGFPILATGTKTGLANVYNPTHEEMAQIKSALWQSNVIEVISTLFKNNPMDAVIGCIALYATPTVGSKKSVILGTVDTGVDSYEVTNQYITVNCGSVSVSELYGDARDYAPYTSVSIYLPFVGICDLNANDVIGGDLYVTYKIDVLTGICLVELRVVKYGANQLLYTFTGNCAVQIPLTGQDYSRQIEQALQSIITGAAIIGAGTSFGGASSSSALAPLGYAGSAGGLEATVNKGAMYAGGASIAKGVSNGAFAKPNVMHAGSLGGNAGAMGVKKPYLIINRQLPYDATSYNKLYGFPSNERVTLGTLTGFTKVKDIHVDNVTCTDEEKREIENLLMQGVII